MTAPRHRPLLVCVIVLLAAVGGFLLGGAGYQKADWHTTTLDLAQVVGERDELLVSIRVDGWTYGIDGAVDHWLDRDGAMHDAGWPACLMPRHPGGPPEQNHELVTVRFASVKVDADALGWRPVVMVDCRVDEAGDA